MSKLINPLEYSVYEQINQYLCSCGLQILKLDARLSLIARNHSKIMAANGFCNHTGVKSRYQQIYNIFGKQRGVAENVAYNQGCQYPAITAVKGWIKSPDHHKNIVSGYKVTGIGVVNNSKGYYYFTQLFVK